MWEFLSKDVNLWSKSSLDCQQNKIQVHVKAPILQIPISHINLDLVGPLLKSQGFSYLFTIIDRASCWPDGVPILQTTTEECAQILSSLQLSPATEVLNLVFPVQVFGNCTFTNNIFPSSIQWPRGKISQTPQGILAS